MQREEKFFSKDITHIVTSRAIPTEGSTGAANEKIIPSSVSARAQEPPQVRTINPSLLDKSSERPAPKGKFTFEAPVSRQTKPLSFQDIDPRKERNGKRVDVLVKAKEMGVKIWQLEKFDRIITLLNGDDGERTSRHEHNTRGKPNAVAAPKVERKNDLSHLLKDEKLNGPVDREPTGDIVMFKGPYIYVHDIHEKYKPIMVREYPKVENREDGAWPHFRSVSAGKCPFVEEVSHDKREREKLEKERVREEERQAQINKIKARPVDAPRTRAAAAVESIKMKPPQTTRQASALAEIPQRANMGLQKPQNLPANGSRAQDVLGKAPIPAKGLKHFPAGDGPGFYGGEPTASGLQQSNVTSAIRSQMISSTAAVPGAKAGWSKEVHELKRKVLERNSGPTLNELARKSMPNKDQPANRTVTETCQATQKIQEKRGQRRLVNIEEEETSSGEEEPKQQTVSVKDRLLKAMKLERKDPKPGYCENCRDKFDDFDDVSDALFVSFVLLSAHTNISFHSMSSVASTDDSLSTRTTGRSWTTSLLSWTVRCAPNRMSPERLQVRGSLITRLDE